MIIHLILSETQSRTDMTVSCLMIDGFWMSFRVFEGHQDNKQSVPLARHMIIHNLSGIRPGGDLVFGGLGQF